MKEFFKKYLGWIVAIIVIIILIFSLDKCNSIKNQSKMDADFYKKQRDGVLDSFNTFKTSSGQTIAYQNQILASKDAIIGNVISEKELKDKKISKLDEKLSAVQTLLATGVLIPFSDTANMHKVIVIKDSISQLVNCMEVPMFFAKGNDTSWFMIKGVVDTNGLMIDSVSFLSNPTFTVGIAKRPGFVNWFKKPVATVFYQDANPYAHTLSMNNIKVKYQEKFYEKKWFWFLLGNFTGAGLTVGLSKAIGK